MYASTHIIIRYLFCLMLVWRAETWQCNVLFCVWFICMEKLLSFGFCECSMQIDQAWSTLFHVMCSELSWYKVIIFRVYVCMYVYVCMCMRIVYVYVYVYVCMCVYVCWFVISQLTASLEVPISFCNICLLSIFSFNRFCWGSLVLLSVKGFVKRLMCHLLRVSC